MNEDNYEEIKKFQKFMELNEECSCLDGSFEDFDNCCGKKHGIVNPVKTLFKMVAKMSSEIYGSEPRLRDMEPEQAKKTLEKIFNVLES